MIANPLFYTKACLKNAFRQMYSTLSGRFVPNEGGVAGYVDRIRHKYHAKWGMQMAGMIFQTRSSYVQIILSFLNEAVTPGTLCLILQCDSFKINSNVLTYIINMPHQCYNLFLIIIRHIHTVIIIGRFSPIVSCIIIVICTSHLV